MKAVLLVGGEGTRMRPLTHDVPKPLLPIAGIPYLEHQIHFLKRFGVNEIILTACYLSEQIQDFCKLEKKFNIKLTYVVEESPLGTGGAIGNVSRLLDGTFLAFNGDILTNFDLHNLLRRHREEKASITIALVGVEDPTRYGVADLKPDGRIRRFIEKPKREDAPTHFINAGMYVMEPESLRHIPAKTKFSVELNLFPLVAKMNRLYGLVQDAYWLDMGTPGDYLQAHWDFLSGKISLTTETSLKVSKSAKFVPPVLIGEGCSIAENARIGPYAVLGRNCIVGEKAEVMRSVLWDGVQVGKGASISESILGSGVSVGEKLQVMEQTIRSAHVIPAKAGIQHHRRSDGPPPSRG